MMALMYAAGRGLRLGPASGHQPKILLEVGGKTILEWHFQRLAEVGIRELVLVTGFERAAVGALLARLQKRYPIAAREVVNDAYEEGSVLSFHVSLPMLTQAGGAVLLMDGDVIYPKEFLLRLVGSPHRSCLLIDREYSQEDDDPVLVPIRQGRPFEFRKKWSGEAEAVGESIGFFKLDPADFPLLIAETEKRAAGAARQDSYDDVLRQLVVQDRFGCEDVTGYPWTEIDFPKDLEFARKTVLPAIMAVEKEV